MSPLARRGSRFWGRTEWPPPLFGEERGPFGELVDCSKPPDDALGPFLELAFVLARARSGDWADGSAVGNSRSAKSSNQERKYGEIRIFSLQPKCCEIIPLLLTNTGDTHTRQGLNQEENRAKEELHREENRSAVPAKMPSPAAWFFRKRAQRSTYTLPPSSSPHTRHRPPWQQQDSVKRGHTG